MKTVAEYLADCLALANPLPPFDVSLDNAKGCILAEDVRSKVDVPLTNLAALDGYGVLASDIVGASKAVPITLPVVGEVHADAQELLSNPPGSALRMASGAPIPEGIDTIVPLAHTDQGRAQVNIVQATPMGSNIWRRAEDMAAGSVVLTAGVRIGSRQISLLASAGHGTAYVHPKPRVVIISVGDELQEPGRLAQAGKIYDANSHALASAVQDAGGVVYRVGQVSDARQKLRQTLEDQEIRADIIITTGGLSYGGGDTVKDLLSPLGTVRFDNVAMAPGKQMGVGKFGDAVIFCLPGSPVAALTCFEVYIRSALRKMAGYSQIHQRSIRAKVVRGWESPQGIQEFVAAKVIGSPTNGYRVEATVDTSHPMLSGFAQANALAIVPPEQRAVAVGDDLNCLILDR
ncbi:MAG: molybdopterin molybdotransferase MoeA [Arcanobacterium sp.]|nr:molybdopterin molybdotransferase MoeA [Arcanobacterium sp.]